MNASPARRALAVAGLALALVACSAPAPTSAPPSGEGPATVELLDFEAPLLDGGTFRGQDLAGKDVAFWFWAPW